MERIKRSCGWKISLSWAVLIAVLLSGNSAVAAVADDIAEGLDNSSFTYSSWVDGANPPFLVATEGVSGGDAVRTGAITRSTSSESAENGFQFDFVGPGTLAFQWSVSGQPIVNGIGSYLWYSVIGEGPRLNGSITGTVGFQAVEITVPAGTNTLYVAYTRSYGSYALGADAGWIDRMVWTPSSGPDTTPDAFSFTAQGNVPLSTVVASNTIAIGGINAAADINISGCSTSCEYSINGAGWTSAAAAAAVSNGDSIQVRQTSSASYAATTTLTLNIGGVTAPFNVTTESAPVPDDTTPDAFSFTAQGNVPLSTVMESNTIAISGINAAADISISGCSSSCEYSINSGGWTSAAAAAAVSNGDSIQVRQTSSASYAATTTLTLDIGGVTAPFNVTTESAPVPDDTTPDAFSFNAQSDVALSTVMESNTIAISGIDAAADISISGCSTSCEFKVDSGAWTSAAAAAAVFNGDSIQVRQTSSASYAATTTLTLDIGGVTAPFSVTTESAPVPVVVAPTPTGTGIASAFVEPAGNSATACNVSEAAFVNAPVPPPEGVTLPHGMFGFTSTGCTSGFSVNVTVEYPSAIPMDASYWKYDEVLGWYKIPAAIDGNTVSFTVTDNETGDSNAAAGTITDPGGIGLGERILAPSIVPPIPTMSRWGLLILAAALAVLGVFRMRRKTA